MKNAAYLFLLVSSGALADEAALLKCRALTDSAARLACYDAIPAGTPAVAATPAAPQAPVAAPVVAQAAAPAPASTEARDFGLPEKKREQAPPSSIESTIVGTSSGWMPGAQITLANGQVWRVLDGGEVVLSPVENRKVRIHKNYFGTLFLVADGTHHSPKVRRVR